ncbi:MAG: FAD-dependent oxidoreductase, partial [Oscillospiraceae bacterium]|nr:FAD-dependent oxidoreductase [Oscillospiraceae bacterium]
MSYSIRYPHLFSPITLAGTLFSSRLFASPTGAAQLSETNQFPTADTYAYFERKAMGGAASVCVGDAVVDFERGRPNPNHMPLDNPKLRDSFARLADSITKYGAVASVELQHGGGASKDSASRGHQIYGVTEFTDSDGNLVLPYTDEILEDVIRKYAEAAAFAKRCGFGMVTVHGGHGWLISQFVSSIHNTRTDKWGGSIENRCRLPVAILDAIRKAVGPRFPIEIRISGSECHANGYDLDEGIAIAKQLDGHCDLIHVSAGDHEVPEVFTVTHPSMFLPDGANVKYAAEIKKHVKTPVATVGALADPELLEDIIASGKADVVELARALIADPDLPKKAREGRSDEINKCIRCLTCFSHLMQTGQFYCAINPEIGREIDARGQGVHKLEPAERKNVLIIGGGPGGMQSAITAAQRGHNVTLYEKRAVLGGALRCEDEVPFKIHTAEYLNRQAKKLETLGVSVNLLSEITPESASKMNPDTIIAAFGAESVTPPLPGIEYAIESTYAYTHTTAIGENVIIIGGGLVGTELALYLAMLCKNRKITILEALPSASDGGNILHGLALSYELPKYPITQMFSVAVKEITSSGVSAASAGGATQLYPADTVIYATGMRPLRTEADKFRFIAPQFFQIGDCVTPANIYKAVSDGHY